MIDQEPFDDPWPPAPIPASRLRRGVRIAVVLLLIVSMTFLAWVSGRGELRVTPEVRPTIVPISAQVIAPVRAPVIGPARYVGDRAISAPVIAPIAAQVIAPIAAQVIAPIAAQVIAPCSSAHLHPSLRLIGPHAAPSQRSL